MDFLEKIKRLRPVTFEYKKNVPGFEFPDGTQVGLVAQEVEEVFPELVTEIKGGYKGIHYDWLSIYLLQAIQEQQKVIEELQVRIDKLQG